MLVGVATRQYERSLEPLGADVRARGTSKSAVSRRFVTQTQAQLDAWRATSLEDLDLAALLIDGVHVGGHCIVVALGVDFTGAKHPLGLWEGSTENTTVCQGLLTNLQRRGLRTDRSLLVILDGGQALHTAVSQTFGRAALVQRCQVHKRRNVLEHLPEVQRPWVRAILTRAYASADVKTARRRLQDLARRLDSDHPSAAASVREGLEETLTVLELGVSERLQRSLATTNAIESLLSRTRHVKRNVKRWRGGTMVLRWVGAAVLEAANGFPTRERVQGHARAGRRTPCARRSARARRLVGDGSVVVTKPPLSFNSGWDIPTATSPPSFANLQICASEWRNSKGRSEASCGDSSRGTRHKTAPKVTRAVEWALTQLSVRGTGSAQAAGRLPHARGDANLPAGGSRRVDLRHHGFCADVHLLLVFPPLVSVDPVEDERVRSAVRQNPVLQIA